MMKGQNKILSCRRTSDGNWDIYLQTPCGMVRHWLYCGYTKRMALRMARGEDCSRGPRLLPNTMFF